MSKNNTKDKIVRLGHSTHRNLFNTRSSFPTLRRGKIPLSKALTGLAQAIKNNSDRTNDDIALDYSVSKYVSVIAYHKAWAVKSKKQYLYFSRLTTQQVELLEVAEKLAKRRKELLDLAGKKESLAHNLRINYSNRLPTRPVKIKDDNIKEEHDIPLRLRLESMIEAADKAIIESNKNLKELKSTLKM